MPRGGRRFVSTTTRTTSTPSAMQVQEMMPIHLLFWAESGLEAAELSGSTSETLPTLGREIELEEDSSLERFPARSLEVSLDTAEEDDGFTDLLETAEEDGLEDGAEVAAEEGFVLDDGGTPGIADVSGSLVCGTELPPGEVAAPITNTLRELVKTSNTNIIKMDSTFLSLLIYNPPSDSRMRVFSHCFSRI